MTDSPIHDMLVRGYEARMLDEWFEHEAGCEATHKAVECSGDVAAIHMSRHNGRVLVCGATLKHQREAIAKGYMCAACKRDGARRAAADCWQIIPV